MTKIVFMGTPQFSVPILKGVVKAGYDVCAVVTQPDRPVGRKKVLTASPVKEAALSQGIEVLQPEKISGSAEMAKIIAMEPDFIITAAFGQFLPEKLLQCAKIGAINVHASLLPKYRGGAPVHYAIINGEKETGVTIMKMVKKMDAGAILSQQAIPITKQDDVGTLFDKLSALGQEMLLEILPRLVKNEVTEIPQIEAEATFSPNIQREEEMIEWQQTATQIDCKIRGMRPWPVAYTVYQGQRWKIWDVQEVAETTQEAPGVIIAIHKQSFWVAAGQGTIVQINKLQPAGKGQLTASQFLNGIGKEIQIGEPLGE